MKKSQRKKIVILLLSVFMIFLGTSTFSQTIDIGGSTTVLPIIKEAKADFETQYPGTTLTITASGSSKGFAGVANKTLHIGMMSRALKEKEKVSYPDITPITIGKDAVAIIVHSTNSIVNLTKAQVKAIFTGATTNWSVLGGSNSLINIHTRESSSGTLAAFKELALNKANIVSTATAHSSNTKLKTAVSEDVNAIGFIGINTLDSNVNDVIIDKIKPSLTSDYPYFRYLYVSTIGKPMGLADLIYRELSDSL